MFLIEWCASELFEVKCYLYEWEKKIKREARAEQLKSPNNRRWTRWAEVKANDFIAFWLEFIVFE